MENNYWKYQMTENGKILKKIEEKVKERKEFNDNWDQWLHQIEFGAPEDYLSGSSSEDEE